MKDRVIFHIDINHCYAQIEEMMYPALQKVSMAVGGHEETRHGIILTKNDLAKAKGIRTGESLREAYEKDPDLLIIPPHYEEYMYYTEKVKEIYRQYSDQVESFGLDEAWIDYTSSQKLFGEPEKVCREIVNRVEREVGLKVSAGVSWNKIFAKLGSDQKKQDGPCVITRENYQTAVWPLPVQDLLYVGPATYEKLHRRAIRTIGDLAHYPVHHLQDAMGAAGTMIHAFAWGEDPSPVAETGAVSLPKSVGNSMTMIHDATSLQELRPVYYVLCEAVASRLRQQGLEGQTVSVSLRSAGLDWYGCEKKLRQPTNLSTEIFQAVMDLVTSSYDFQMPLRAVGVSISHLNEMGRARQLDLFIDENKREKARRADIAIDEIRDRYGFYAVRRACTLVDRPLSEFNVKEDHTIHPTGYFQGRKMTV
ncbi:MAG: DNA polymerase IV [Solobacterium sp.]|jgi:DNA polymerase-4|nr:DNA polymerase IV [Solobacterium sp.]MCH4205696.1 DNA polymerase IV [Solobacterium sp.]MCH4227220.1 DNA polymerase IV [Solobacterium sp.]MCH4282526.1 DNA polymerase IV [Solobacterium sp.]